MKYNYDGLSKVSFVTFSLAVVSLTSTNLTVAVKGLEFQTVTIKGGLGLLHLYFQKGVVLL